MACEELCVVKALFEVREDTAIRAGRQKWEKTCAVLYVRLTPTLSGLSPKKHIQPRMPLVNQQNFFFFFFLLLEIVWVER